MTLKEFTNSLIKLMEERPEAANYHVVTSKDDEGNGYSLVYYEPQVGHFDEEEKEFYEERKLN